MKLGNSFSVATSKCHSHTQIGYGVQNPHCIFRFFDLCVCVQSNYLGSAPPIKSSIFCTENVNNLPLIGHYDSASCPKPSDGALPMDSTGDFHPKDPRLSPFLNISGSSRVTPLHCKILDMLMASIATVIGNMKLLVIQV